MKVKTADLIEPALDWAVAKCESVEVEYINDGITQCILRVSPFTGVYKPSTNWSQGAPLIAKHIFLLEDLGDYEWEATAKNGCKYRGDTVLQAVCRAFVASQLGEEVDIPEELLK